MKRSLWTSLMCIIAALSLSGPSKPLEHSVKAELVYIHDTVYIRDTIVDSIIVYSKYTEKQSLKEKDYFNSINKLSMKHEIPASIIAGIGFVETTLGHNTSTGDHTGINVNRTGTYFGMFAMNPKFASKSFKKNWKNVDIQVEECFKIIKRNYNTYLLMYTPLKALKMSLSAYHRGKGGVNSFLAKQSYSALFSIYADKVIEKSLEYEQVGLTPNKRLNTWLKEQNSLQEVVTLK